MTQSLTGKVAIVTGAGGAIGRHEALALARAGASVVVNDPGVRDADAAQRVANDIIAAGGAAVVDTHDIAAPGAAREIVDLAVGHFGRLDILINNAGIGKRAAAGDISDADWDRILDVNLSAAFRLCREALPHMRAMERGVIVVTASDAGVGTYAGTPYAAAKEGLVGLARAMAWETARDNILCLAIRPRAFDGDLSHAGKFAEFQAFEVATGVPVVGTHPFATNIFPRGSEVGEVVAWLAATAPMSLNGRVVQIGGGEIGLWAEPHVERVFRCEAGWDAESLDTIATGLFEGIHDPRAGLDDEGWRQLTTRNFGKTA